MELEIQKENKMFAELKENEIIITDFFDSNGQLLTPLISDDGDNNLKELIFLLTEQVKIPDRRNPRKMNKINDSLKGNQLRKFYDSFNRVFNSKIDEGQKKVQLLMLKSNGEYSANRLKIKRFEIFLSNRINIVLKKSGKDFEKYMEALKLHFEALVGYFPKN